MFPSEVSVSRQMPVSWLPRQASLVPKLLAEVCWSRCKMQQFALGSCSLIIVHSSLTRTDTWKHAINCTKNEMSTDAVNGNRCYHK